MVKEIGMDDIVKLMLEFCGVIFKNLIVKVIESKIVEEEGYFNFEVLE